MFCGARSYRSISIKGLFDLGLACMDSRTWGLYPLFLVVTVTTPLQKALLDSRGFAKLAWTVRPQCFGVEVLD